ncbi:DUF7535 family protein [Halostella salina]|uniref:DUF7535 family protein n=1 Tax=Halostella salina TaxID=1547897 RepID=UPI000EF850FB|nr:hypothetical protein [Halostella salina]
MSDSDDDPALPRKVLRTATPPYAGHEDREMNVIGWSVFLGMVVLLVPLLPFILILWVLTKLLDRAVEE